MADDGTPGEVVEAGTVGQVAKIRLVEESPLVVRFPGLIYQVAPLPHMLKLVEDGLTPP